MKITIDKESGCCNGVSRAIEEAEHYLDTHSSLYSLGAIVHNDMELNRLKQKGLVVIDYPTFNQLHDTTVLIRAHGEPPSTYETALRNHLELIDCTCPVVLKLQKKIASTYSEISPEGGQIVIYGKIGHAEVNGLVGQVKGNALVVEKSDDIDHFVKEGILIPNLPIAIFSQTTKDHNQYLSVCSHLAQYADTRLIIHNSICGQVSSKRPHLENFAQQNSVILFVAGKDSSNGKILYELCKRVNKRSYMIENTSDIRPEWFNENDTVGICGATSTRKWQLENIFSYLCGSKF